MVYLSCFSFPDFDREYEVRLSLKRTCYDTMYPFFVLSGHGLTRLDFAPITILYGGNGSGKTTALNIIAEKIKAKRETLYNRSSFFDTYVNLCRYETEHSLPSECQMIASDDVFDYMLNIRSLNEGIDRKREELFDEYLDAKYSHFQMRSTEDYEQLKKVCMARSKTQSKYVRSSLMKNVREQSNGESAFFYFTDKLREGGLYLLDEPENSLSPEKQLELLKFLEESARFFDCQLIIATHSPFLLSLRGAKIYDFDENPVDIKKWTQLANVRTYYEFFKQHEEDFEKRR